MIKKFSMIRSRFRKEKSTFKFENRYVTSNGDNPGWYCNSTFKEGLIYATAKNIRRKKLRELNREVRSLAKIGSWNDLVNESVF
jgi:hypothetical protein